MESGDAGGALSNLDERTAALSREASLLKGDCLYCVRCNAVWRLDAIRETPSGNPSCLVCGGPLALVP